MPRLKQPPADNLHPLVRQLFEEQDRTGMSSMELSARSGVTWHAISEIRRGTRKVSVGELTVLAAALKLKLELVKVA